MNYINFLASLYIGIAMIGCNAAQMGDTSVGKEEISPRDQDQQSPRRITFLGKSIDLRKAIANSSPRKTESPHRNSSRDDIEKSSGSLSKESSPRDLESPRTRLKRSQSMVLSQPKRDNKTLQDVKALEKGSSPRGEEMVVALLRAKDSKSSPDVDEIKVFRNKSVDFTLSSPSPKHLIGEQPERSSTGKQNDKKLPKPLSEEDQRLLQSGIIEVCSKNREQWQLDFNKTLEQLVTNHEERLLAKLPKELQKQEEQA